MLHKAVVRLEFTGRREAEAIAAALEPDNVELPAGMKLGVYVHGRSLLVRASFAGKTETLLSTVEDILESLQASIESLAETG